MFKLFGGKKKDRGFYLELDEKKASQPAVQEATEAPPALAVQEVEPKPPEGKDLKKTPAKKEKAPKAAKKTKEPKAAREPKVKEAKPEPVAAVSAPAKSEPLPGNFATEYLLVQSRSRRRPGPSLNQFKEMARQVKVPQGQRT